MIEFIQVHTSRLAEGETDPVAAVTWINPQHIVRIDGCDTRTQHDGGELAMILELSNGNELYVPVTTSEQSLEPALATAIRTLLSHATGPIVGLEIASHREGSST